MFGISPVERVEPVLFTTLPERYRRSGDSEWAMANIGSALDSFLEGPAFDRSGNLLLADIPFGRIFRIDGAGNWALLAEYDGWPNGIAVHADGRVFIADHRRGIVCLGANGKPEILLDRGPDGPFLGPNDLTFSDDGSLFFTDQGMTGWQNSAGRLYRWSEETGALDVVLAGIPSPNGLVWDLPRRMFLAVTRANAVWRVPLAAAGEAVKVGTFLQMSGGFGGPDGMALDEAGGLIVAHPGTGVWRFDANGIPSHHIALPGPARATNVAFGGPDNRNLFITESDAGAIFMARMPFAGRRLFSHS